MKSISCIVTLSMNYGKISSGISQILILRNKKEVNIAGIDIFNDRIRFHRQEILFEDLDIRRYRHHFMIFSKQDNYKNKMLYHLKDKDAVILLDVLTKIIKNE